MNQSVSSVVLFSYLLGSKPHCIPWVLLLGKCELNGRFFVCGENYLDLSLLHQIRQRIILDVYLTRVPISSSFLFLALYCLYYKHFDAFLGFHFKKLE